MNTPVRVFPLIVLASLLAPPARGEDRTERFDHEGAVGLLLGAGLMQNETLEIQGAASEETRFPGLIGVTDSVDADGHELVFVLQPSYRAHQLAGLGAATWRGTFGEDRVHTFYDLGLAFNVLPTIALGPRIGCGLQYEWTSLVGTFLAADVDLTAGGGIKLSGTLAVGLQLRSYLLE